MSKITLFSVFIFLINGCHNVPNRNPYYDLEMKAYNSSMAGDYKIAIKYYDTLIGLDTLKGEYYFGRAYAYSQIPKYNKEGIRNYLRAIALNYRVGDSYYAIGLEYSFLDDSSALFYFKKAVQAEPKNQKYLELYNLCQERLIADSLRSR